ncbi:Outer membrane efflux protein [Leptospira interrogans serovar Manilae]|uniref:Outer membrane efflux protein n=1 Tax=Leptospira interrogans serovar Manilae TaxID=214675 RepID=A0AAQ1NY00_LEPIR|nr:TolC family protein [Leptospira interrogans]AKP25197.1 channel protein TolC [Leptospira interrogans serovar Manilae]AKP28981.1 channel protein TolC [Leptospira interrogans serovar Manilae]EYU62203.1 channel protein TolC [Leptospira interrogans serovar Manilae]SOR61591.1 Outer membrane efflux protein [Leptospira interrogans serovar Manilae]
MYYKKKRTLEKLLVFGTILLTMIQPTWSEDILPEEIVLEENKKSSVENLGDSKKILRLTLKDAVNYVLEKNITIQNAKMEYIKADGGELKNESQFTWNLIGGITVFRTTLPANRNNIFAGTKQSQDKLSVGIEKNFRTGTYAKLEASTTRFDTSAFENPSTTPSNLAALAIPPLYTGALTITLSQEILKYSFGKTQKEKEAILRQNTVIKREELIYVLSQLVAQTLIQYWSLNIYNSNVKTLQDLESNTRNIRDLTVRKRNLGLSESFEVNLWNSILSQTAGNLEKAKVSRKEAERNLIRILNADPSSKIEGVTDLQENVPLDFNVEKDYIYALEYRTDLKNLRKQREIAELNLKIKEAEDMPSLKLSGAYSTRGQNIVSPQQNLTDGNRGVASFKYPEAYAAFQFSYPLWDKGIKADIRNAKLDVQNLEKKEAELKLSIKEELENRYAAIVADKDIFEGAKKRKEEANKFYKGLSERFRQGRFTAVAVKNALDNVIQSELQVTQAKIQLNIDILRYELAKNHIFERFGVNVNDIIDRLMKMVDIAQSKSSTETSEK